MSTTPAVSSQGESTRPSNSSLEVRPDGRARFEGCSKISAYEVLSKLGEGTFGEVHKARSIKTGAFVALKKILMHNEKDGFPITALREIKLLKMLSHPNVLKLEEMAVEHRKKDGRKKAVMYMVTPYMDHDLSGLLENPAVRITEPQIKCYMLQLLEGLRYLHAQQILHRDMKAANLLINNKGILQIADFGLARPYDDPPPMAGEGGGEATRDYTTLVVTRWYRPPELLLQLRKYTTAIDLWGVGCVFGEMFTGRPILAGKSDLNQIEQIFQLVGSPTDETMPGWSSLPGCEGISSFSNHRSNLHNMFREQGSGMISLITELLRLDWRKRINAMDALKHPYFTTAPLPLKPGEIPKFEESHELDRRKFRDQQGALPPAPAGGTVGIGPNAGDWGGANGNNNRRQGGPPLHHHGPPRNGQHDNRPRGAGGTHNDRRPGWQNRDRDRDPPHRERVSTLPPHPGLPPRPATTASWSGWAGDPPPEAKGARIPDQKHGRGEYKSSWAGETNDRPRSNRPPPSHAGGNKDTYIPDYSNGSGDGRNRRDRGRHDRDRSDWADRDQGRDDDRRSNGRDDDRRSNDSRRLSDSRRRSRSPVRISSKERIRDNSKDVYGRR